MNPLPPHDLRAVLPDGAGVGMPSSPGVGQPIAAGVAPPPPIVNAPPNGMALLKALKRRWQVAVVAASVAAIGLAAGIWTFVPNGKQTARAVLELNPRILGPIPSRDPDVPRIENFRELQKTLIKNQKTVSGALRDPKVAQVPTLKSVGDPPLWLEQNLSINFPGDANILEVKLEGDRADDIRILLNAVVKSYLADFITSEEVVRNTRLEALKQVEADLNAEMQRTEAARREFFKGGELGLSTLPWLQSDITRLQTKIADLDFEIKDLEAKAKQLERHDPAKGPLDERYFQEALANDQNLQQLRARLGDATANVTDAISKRFTASVVDRLKGEQIDLEKQVREREQIVRGEAETYWRPEAVKEHLKNSTRGKEILEGKGELVASLRKNLAENQRVHEGIVRNTVRPEDSPFRFDATADALRQVTTDKKRLEAEAKAGPRVRELEEARVIPVDPREKKFKMALLGGSGAFLMVLVGLALWEFQGRRVDSTDQIVYGLGLPLVGTVPAMPQHRLLGFAGGASNEEWRFAVQQAVATARTVLLNAARSTNMRMVMITSATAGEGKTSLSTQLAVSLAMAGHRTLLLDFDMRNPSAHKLLGMPRSPGWAEILRGEMNVAEAIRPTSLEKLSFIPAGECDPIALMSLVQDELGQVLNWLRSQYDFVIVDTCPVLPVVDALLLGRHMDGVIFSVLNEVSQIPKIYVATQRITQLGIRLLGAVVNGVKEDKYGYGTQGASRRPRTGGMAAIQTPYPAHTHQTPRPNGPAVE